MNDTADIIEFLKESNAIEAEYSDDALRDALNAWRLAMTYDLLTPSKILDIHNLLMADLRPDIAGKYRDCDVFIGGERKVFRGREVLDSQVQDVCNLMLDSFRLDTDEERIAACKTAHIDFEGIHPFEDGNGRTGRIIYNWHRLKLGLPLHIIHEGAEQYEYYDWFKK